MATKILNGRLKLKYDTIENWNNSDNQFVLLSGEAGLAADQSNTGAVFIKIGDGVHTWNELPLNLYALPFGVYDWAKTQNLEWETAFENNSLVLSGLSAYIEDHSTSTIYTLSAIDNADSIGLQFRHKEPDEENWTNGESITISEGNTNGTIHVALSGTSKDISVHGLGTAAYMDTDELFRAGFTIVDELPVAGANTMDKIYLLASATSAGNDNFVSYITLSAEEGGVVSYDWEKVGDSSIALSNLSGNATVDGDFPNGAFYALTSVTQHDGKIAKGGQVKLAAIAKSTSADVTITDENFILDCGGATV